MSGMIGTESLVDERMASLSRRMKELLNWGDENLVQELVEIFLTDTPPRMAHIAAAVKGSDAKALASYAHALKGGSANMGADLLASVCAKMEHFGRTNAMDEAAQMLPEVEVEFQRTLEAVEMLRPVSNAA